ncbi:MAG: tRNA (adenosine(37)-N6)-threonylcarbamoyltransferase complex transferase subunit TsaD [Lentisphaerae bacterium]|nr:tRNA (adenosine(37)-N6)-threonylcarbamoyltransferase complex transferase subunit TsaD [Lentisphaerota bacterium]
MNILGIETSCDETAAAVVRDGRRVLSSVVSSQADVHGPYGGVVPEIASRQHAERLPGVTAEALRQADVDWPAIDAVAVTYGPGLATSLVVGLAFAKSLALRLDRPLVGVNHLEAHVYSVFLGREPESMPEYPWIALIVSGGHTCLVRVEGVRRYGLLGQTVDDAAGEAFDKGANLLGLGYPGGPAIDAAADGGNARAVRFPVGRQRRESARFPGLRADLCFSFSGLKTALLYHLKAHPLSAAREEVPDLAASYQEAIVKALESRCARAVRGETCLAVVGGVSLNRVLRARMEALAEKRGFRLVLAERRYGADNAAMIAGLAGAGGGVAGPEALCLDVDPNLAIGAQ